MCKNSVGQTVQKTTSVAVKAAATPPAKPAFSADKTTVQSGGNVLFSWSSPGASSCVLNPGNYTANGSTGSKLVRNLTRTTTFSLVCSNNAGNATANPVTITVTQTPPPPADPIITSFKAVPTAITSGATSTLSWTASNVVAGGCSLTPSPLSSTSASGQWVTPRLTVSTSYTLTCKNAANKLTSKSLSVIVANQPAPPPPAPQPPTTPPSESGTNDDAIVTSSGGGTPVNNSQVNDSSRGGLVTLDPTNVTDSEKVAHIVKVEYYSGETLIQTVTKPPFALNTDIMEPGEYTITERVYYDDGSESELTQTITIEAKEDQAAAMLKLAGIILGTSAAVLGVVSGIGFLTRRFWLPTVRPHIAWLNEFLNKREMAASFNHNLGSTTPYAPPADGFHNSNGPQPPGSNWHL